MTQKTLVTLAAAAAVLAGAAYISNSSKKVKAPSLVGKPVLKAFDLSEVAKIEAGAKDGSKLTLASTDAGWVISSLHGYPADIVKIRANLLKLQDLKAGHVASGKKLDNPVLVDLQNASGKPLATLRLGDKHMRQATGEMAQFGGGAYPDGRYVSGEGSDTVVLVKDSLDAFDGDPKNWADTQIASVPADGVTVIELTRDGKTAKLAKTNGVWGIGDLGANEEFASTKTYSVESVLSYLNFTSIVDPALTDEQLGMAPGATLKLTLQNGESYTAKIGNAPEGSADRYFKISAAFTPVGTNDIENAAAQQKVDAFNAKSGKWTYTVPSYNADNMLKTRADFVTAKEEPKKESEEQ